MNLSTRTAILLLGMLAALVGPIPGAAGSVEPRPAQLDVRVFAPPVFSPNGDGVQDRARVRFTLDSAARVVVTVRRHSWSGPAPVLRRQLLGRRAAGTHVWWWNGGAGGRRVPDGLYSVTVTAVAGVDGTRVRDRAVRRIEVDRVIRPGKVLVSDPVVYPRTTVVRDRVTLTMRTREHWYRGTLLVRNAQGRVVFQRSHSRHDAYYEGGPEAAFAWTGRTSRGALPPGTYTAVHRVADRAGNRGATRPTAIEVSANRLVWKQVSQPVRPADGRAWNGCPIHGGSGPNGCADYPPCGTVGPSAIFPEGGLSHRSAVCADPTHDSSFAGSEHLVRFPEARRDGLDAIKVSFTGAPTHDGEADAGTLYVGTQRIESSAGGSSVWERDTRFSDGYVDPHTSAANLPPSAYWQFRAHGDDAFDVGSFTLDVRYLFPAGG